MANNLQVIVQFLEKRGLGKTAIAGIVGNIGGAEDTRFDPGAINSNEGAIGIAQWEGSRRTALQNFARQHGGHENDLDMQLKFMWHELTSDPQRGVLRDLGNASSAAEAATIWDEQYERSAGTTRQQRINAAEKWYNTGHMYGGVSSNRQGSFGSGVTGGQSPAMASVAASGGGGGGGGGGTGMSSADTAATLKGDNGLGDLGNLFESIPDLSKVLDQAQKQGWSTARFENAVQDTDWWKQHSSSARSIIAERANDPASWTQSMRNAENTITNLSGQLGMHLQWGQVFAMANNAMLTGNDTNQQWLTQQISSKENYSGLKTTDGLHGQMANTVQQLQQMASSYGYNWSAHTLAQRAQQVVSGATTIDTDKQNLMAWAKSAFPALGKQIDAGQTIADLAAPYQQSMSNLLEIDPGTLDTFTPAIRKALQGSTDPTTKDRAVTPLWQFEQQLRTDPRWQFTQNATDTMSSALVKIGQDFGFGF